MDKADDTGREPGRAPLHESFYGELEKSGVSAPKRPRISINIVLFVLTIATTLLAGALHQGINPLEHPEHLVKGVPFSLALLLILLSHEMGHYLISKKYRVDATLPYFIPAPTFIGTFGAFIKMRSPVRNKKVLFDIGAAGPLAGIAVTLPILMIGLKFSEVTVTPVHTEEGLVLGTSLLLSFLTKVILGNLPDNYTIVLHPFAFAGWIGLLVTSLNLMPVGQLDGGHIAYAVCGRKTAIVSKLVLVILLGLGIWGAHTWLIWTLLLFLLGTRHPPTVDSDISLDKKRKVIGLIMLLIFVLTFIPIPFNVAGLD